MNNSTILKIIGPIKHNDDRERRDNSGVLNEMK